MGRYLSYLALVLEVFEGRIRTFGFIYTRLEDLSALHWNFVCDDYLFLNNWNQFLSESHSSLTGRLSIDKYEYSKITCLDLIPLPDVYCQIYKIVFSNFAHYLEFGLRTRLKYLTSYLSLSLSQLNSFYQSNQYRFCHSGRKWCVGCFWCHCQSQHGSGNQRSTVFD